MKSVVLISTILVSVLAKPNGFYHQEYNYRTSSSSYKNHELQHRNDDEGFYSKAGDLEGRVRPQVNAHSQHSEYVNPKLQHGYRIGTDRTSSYGQLHAQNRFQPGEMRFAGPDLGAGFGYGEPQVNYGVNSDLRQVTASLQEQMERELQTAVYDHYQRAMAYGGTITQAQIENDRRILEEELRRNMTMRLQEALKSQYGNQGIRGAYSYSIMNGRLQPSANYHNQELTDLTRQMEAHLMRFLNEEVRTQYQTRVDTQVHTQRNTYQRVNGINDNYLNPTQHRPVVYHPYPPQPQQMPPHQVVQPHQVVPHQIVQPHQVVQPHPVAPIPDSITTVATRVQTELNEILNKILEDTQRRYFSENTFNSGVNYDAVLAQLQDELRSNITFHFDDQIKRAYGYSNYASKYSVEDIENLRRQIENNLVTKLNRDFNKQRQKFFSTHMYVVQPMPANHVMYPVNNMQYNHEVAEIQRQLQEQMSRQLQMALMQQSYRQAHMYRSSDSRAANYQTTLNELSAELNKNLTRQMEQINRQNAQLAESAAYEAQLANMRNQLQHDLQRQLQQGLQQSYSRYSSWSGSASSSSNYRSARAFDPSQYQVYPGDPGEDCMMGDDPSAYQQQEEGDDLTQQAEAIDADLTQQTLTHDALTQQTEDDDLTQQVQTEDFSKPGTSPYQQIREQTQDDNQDLTQQVQTEDFSNPQNQDLTQQTEDDFLTKPRPYQYQQIRQIRPPVVQKPVPSPYASYTSQGRDLTQQVQSEDFSNLQNQDLTQQTEDDDQYQQIRQIGPLVEQKPVPPQYASHSINDVDYTQQVQTQDLSNPPRKPNLDLTQQTQDLTQQTEDDDLLPKTLQNQVGSQPGPLVNQDAVPSITRTYYYTSRPEIYQRPPAERLIQPVQPNQQFTSQSQTIRPIRYQVYRTQQLYREPTLTQQSQQVVEEPYQRQQTYSQTTSNGYRRYQSPQYTSTYEWNPQKPSRDRVGQRVQYYENLQRQIYPSQKPSSYGSPSQGRQIELDDLTQQVQTSGQQTQDLTQQTQNSEFAPLTLGSQQNQDLYQQSADLTRPTQQNQDLYQQTADLTRPTQTQDLYQQTADLTRPSQNLIRPNQDLTQQSQTLIQPNLYQQTADLTRPNQDLTQQSEDLTQQSEDLRESRPWDQQTQDLTQSNQQLRPNQDLTQNIYQQSADLTKPNQDLYQQSQQTNQWPKPNQKLVQPNQDLTQQTEDLTQQTDDLTRPVPHWSEQGQDLTQQNLQSQDLIQQEIDDSRRQQQQSQYRVVKPQDVTQQIQQSDDLTQQSEDLTQQSEDLTQQSEDLTQQSEDLTQQSEDLTQQSEDLTQQNQDLTQQSEDLTQQSQDWTQQTQDLSHQNQQSQDQRQSQYRVIKPQDQQSYDLTQQTEDLTQQSQDLTQQSEDLTQQTEDLTQQSEDLTQQTEDIDQPIEPQPSSNKIIKDDNNEQYDERSTTFSTVEQNEDISSQQTDEQKLREAQRQSQRLIDLLREHNQVNEQQNYNTGPMRYSPKPVYADINGHPVQVGTTRNMDQDIQQIEVNEPSQYQHGSPYGRRLTPQHPQVQYAQVETVEPEHVETAIVNEPVQTQVADEVQEVGEGTIIPDGPEVTTKKPGWWSRFKTNVRDKLG